MSSSSDSPPVSANERASERPAAPRRMFIPLGTQLTVPVVLLVAAAALGAYLGVARTSRA